MYRDGIGLSIDQAEEDASWERGLAKAIAAVLACALLIALCGRLLSCQPQGQEATAAQPAGIVSLELSTQNAALMHRSGLPTKADVMQWHTHGQWGYYEGGVLYAYDDLPGAGKAWDELYGIEDNPAFEK